MSFNVMSRNSMSLLKGFRSFQGLQKAHLHARYAYQCSMSSRQSQCRSGLRLARRQMSLFEVEKETQKSFAKNLFNADIDMTWVFSFPTAEDGKDVNSCSERLKQIQEFCKSRDLNSSKLDKEANIPTHLINELKELGLFGLAIPQKYCGLGLSNLELAKLLEDISTLDNSVNMMVASHNLLGAQPILKFGNDEQKEKYLPKLASGDMIAAFCCNEVTAGSDINRIRTKARLSGDGKHWLLSGEKTSINNGGIADLMIVFAKIEVVDVDNELKDTIGAFIVEKSFGNIYNGPQENKMGMRALNTSDVMFDETPVPLENLIGEERDGFMIATETLHDARLGLACGIIGPVRKLVQDTTSYANHRVQFGRTIRDFKLIKEKVYQMAENVYAMESVSYLTMGQYDQAAEEDVIPDLTVESAIAKVFLAQKASEVANDCLEIFGYRAYNKLLPYERILRDTKMLELSEGTTDVLKLYIALSCFKHTESIADKYMRQYKYGTIRMWLKFFRDIIDESNFNQYVMDGFLRKSVPSFSLSKKPAIQSVLDQRMADSLKHFKKLAKALQRKVLFHMRHHGNNLQDEQLMLKRYADFSISMYSMIAVLARCNKSLLLGLPDCQRDFMIAKTFLCKTFRECGLMMDDMLNEHSIIRNHNAIRVGKELLEERRYAIPHPLELEHRFIENPIYLEHFEKILKTLPK